MLTAKQIQQIKPTPFEPMLSYTRFKNGSIVPVTHAAYSHPPRYKREFIPNQGYSVKLKRA